MDNSAIFFQSAGASQDFENGTRIAIPARITFPSYPIVHHCRAFHSIPLNNK